MASNNSAQLKNLISSVLTSAPARGAYAGAGVAAVLSAIRAVSLDKRRKQIYKTPDTDKNTIVLRLPATHKLAAAAELCDLIRTEHPEVTDKQCDPVSRRHQANTARAQKKKPDDAVKSANLFRTRPYREAFDVLKWWAGAAGGYGVIKHVYNKAVDRQLKADEEAARVEFLDAVGAASNRKQASTLDDVFPADAETMDKSAMTVLGYLALLTLMGTGASSYGTKRVLDAKSNELDRTGYRTPPIRQIVIKTEKGENEPVSEKSAQLAVVVKMAELAGEQHELLDDETLKLAAPGADGAALWEALSGNVHAMAKAHPELADSIITNAVRKRPSMARLGFMGRTGGKLRGAAASGLGKLLKMPYVGDLIRRKAIDRAMSTTGDRVASAFQQYTGQQKAAFTLPAGVLASFLGSSAAARTQDDKQRSPAAAPSDDEVAARADRINIVGQDENADEYIASNQEKLQAVLRQMVEEGLI